MSSLSPLASEDRSHTGSLIPYRKHTLTMLLSDVLGGQSKTVIFVNASPTDNDLPISLGSLAFGVRLKDRGANTAPVVTSSQQLKTLKNELVKLKKDSSATSGGASKNKAVLGGGLSRPV